MYVYFFLFTSLFILHQDGDPDWKLKKKKSGIEIYTRTIEGSSFDEFKATITLPNSSLTEVLDIILDVENYVNFYPDCISAEVLSQNGKYYDIHYFSIKAPWPVKNRDAIYESTTTISDNKKYARIELKPLGNYIKEKKNLVRMYNGSGFWEMEEIQDNTVKVIYQFHGDPGGKVPAWLANSYVVSSPFQTMKNLKNILSKK